MPRPQPSGAESVKAGKEGNAAGDQAAGHAGQDEQSHATFDVQHHTAILVLQGVVRKHADDRSDQAGVHPDMKFRVVEQLLELVIHGVPGSGC